MSKENIHLSINPASVKWIEPFLEDLRACVENVRATGLKAAEPMLAALSALDASQMSPEIYTQMLAMAGIEGPELPEKMAEINGLLNALPPALNEQLLSSFVNDLFV